MTPKYFLEKLYMEWFKNPRRPKPPVYTTFGEDSPFRNSPNGKVFPHAKIVQLSPEQVEVWKQT
jgi:hypothetical protein